MKTLVNNKSKTVKKYLQLIKKAAFTENELISFRKLINGSSRLDIDVKQDLIFGFNLIADFKGIKLTKEQQLKGINWLKDVTFKLNGEVRKNASLGHFEQSVVKAFKSFTCVGLYNLSDNNYDQYVPIYRCTARSGRSFDYICKMWGEIEVIAVCESTGETTLRNNPNFENARKGRPLLRIA